MSTLLDTLPPVLSNYAGTSCFINATLHLMFSSKKITALLRSVEDTDSGIGENSASSGCQDGDRLMSRVLRDALTHYRSGDGRPIYPYELLKAPFFHRQQADPSEFIEKLLESDACSSPHLQELFSSSIEHRKICEHCNHSYVMGGSSDREQRMFYLQSVRADQSPLQSVQHCMEYFLKPGIVKQEHVSACVQCSYATADAKQEKTSS